MSVGIAEKTAQGDDDWENSVDGLKEEHRGIDKLEWHANGAVDPERSSDSTHREETARKIGGAMLTFREVRRVPDGNLLQAKFGRRPHLVAYGGGLITFGQVPQQILRAHGA